MTRIVARRTVFKSARCRVKGPTSSTVVVGGQARAVRMRCGNGPGEGRGID